MYREKEQPTHDVEVIEKIGTEKIISLSSILLYLFRTKRRFFHDIVKIIFPAKTIHTKVLEYYNQLLALQRFRMWRDFSFLL